VNSAEHDGRGSASSKAIFIDGHSLAHRAFFALPDSWVTAEGLYTNAVYGFVTMLIRLLDEEKPDYLAVVFDTGRPTFRHTEYGEYKAHRPGTPDRLRGQLPLLKETLEILRVPVYELEGYEADDVLATLARHSREAGAETLIVTGDRDFLQLADQGIKPVLTLKGISETAVFDAGTVRERYGIEPDQFVDYRALVGDPSDNLPGVPGVGPRTAVRLLAEFGSLEQLLANLERVEPERVRRALGEHADQARLTGAMARLRQDVPLAFTMDDCRVRPYDPGQVADLFRRLEFRTLLKKLGLEGEAAQRVEKHPEATPVEDIVLLEQQLDELAAAGTLALAYTASDSRPTAAVLRSLAFAGAEDGVYWARAASDLLTPGLPQDRMLAALARMFRRPGLTVQAANLKFLAVLAGGGADDEAGVRCFDPAVAAYLLDPARFSYEPDLLAREYLGEDVYLPRAEPGKRPAPEPDLGAVLPLQVDMVRRLAPVLEERLADDGMERLFREVEMPLTFVLADMELAGVGVDRAGLDVMARELGKRIEETLREIHSLAGRTFNPNSPRQLAQVLFEDLKLESVKKTPGGAPSTDVEVLEELAAQHQVVARVLEHRQLVKLKGTYVDGLRALVNPTTGRVHTCFNQTGTATGRLSSSEPNLQNIPIRMELGRRIRKVFVPSNPGHRFLAADYSQIELRILAHLSGDPVLIDAFQRGEDIHARTAREVFGTVTPELRNRAKAVNFGLVYGMTDYGLSRDLGVPVAEASRYIERYFQRYVKVQEYFGEVLEQARSRGYVSSLLGRRRYLPELSSSNRQTRSFAERAARNSPIQGSAADLIKLAMVQVHRELKARSLRGRMILQVHDELLFEAPPEELLEIAEVAREAMIGAIRLVVPVTIDLKVGPNWYDLERLEEA
jgi:DNA polymerase-1